MTTPAIRAARPDDLDAIIALLPRLASFDVPGHRSAEDTWRGDRAIVEAWARHERPRTRVSVACDDDGAVLGATVLTLQPEPLSREPGAHLEVLVVAAGAEGQGLGAALLAAAEQLARDEGARSVTLNVFAANTRARSVYERCGYSGEIIRYYKPL